MVCRTSTGSDSKIAILTYSYRRQGWYIRAMPFQILKQHPLVEDEEEWDRIVQKQRLLNEWDTKFD